MTGIQKGFGCMESDRLPSHGGVKGERGISTYINTPLPLVKGEDAGNNQHKFKV